MSFNESAAVSISGEGREHPAVRRLARACIALARWRRSQPVAAAVADQEDDDGDQPMLSPGGRS